MYRFEKINEDTYKLITDDKEFTFTRTIDLVRELQKVDMYTTSYIADMLAERGETFENTKLIVQHQEGGKTIVDESNLKALKEQARNLATYDVMNNIFNKIFGVGYIELIRTLKIDVNNTNEVQKFVTDITNVLISGIKDNTPRE